MSTLQWAEQECRIACRKENPDFNFDSDDFDYGCSCYKSALKAFKSLCEDGHSGTSWNFTKSILERLMAGQPLTPITDDDFFVSDPEAIPPLGGDEWLKEQGLKSDIQCPRMSSLFRKETIDGKVSYTDVNRAFFRDIEHPSDTYSSNDDFLDDMFPITMPYVPKKGKYEIFAQTFLTDVNHGDFDTKGILYLITPEGEKVDVGIYMTEKDGKMVRISEDEYKDLLAKRVDKVSVKVAGHLLWTLLSNSASEEEIERREVSYRSLFPETRKGLESRLEELCKFFDDPYNYPYNTFSMHQALCKGDESIYGDVPELVAIAHQLRGILNAIK